jgi:hypothetical protein
MSDAPKARSGNNKEKDVVEPPKATTWGWSEALRWALTFIIFGVVIWLLVEVIKVQAVPATIDKDTQLTLDVFNRTKDILLIVIPFFTLVLGYWFGVKAADGAQQVAKAATAEAKTANEKADVATQRAEILASVVDPAKYEEARNKYGAFFGKGN